ncbi:MAG: site-2 protease family protein [Acidimicrobiales bacterium]
MGRGELSLGRILGVRVGVSWGLIAIAAIFTLTLAADQYPRAFPGRDGTQYWVAGLATTVLFALSILVHELGHALVARSEGVGVDGVTLWMFGGLARLTSQPRTAGAEARIALAGPAATGLAAGVFWLLATLTAPADQPALAPTMFDWLSRTNLLLLGLNLLPALPLDGGRVLGAAIWGGTRRRSLGELWAARAGWLVGGALVVYGLTGLRDGGAEGLWALLVGGFVLASSRDAERQRRQVDWWSDRRVGDVMRPDPPVVEPWMTVDAMLLHLHAQGAFGRHDVFPVRDERGEIIGVVHLASAAAVPEAMRRTVRVAELTEPRRDVPVVGADEPLLAVVQNHPEVQHGTVMVVDHTGRIVGVLGPESLVQR